MFYDFLLPPCAVADKFPLLLASFCWYYRTRRLQLWCRNWARWKLVERDSPFLLYYTLYRLSAPFPVADIWSPSVAMRYYSIWSVDYSGEVRMELALTLALKVSRKVAKLDCLMLHTFTFSRKSRPSEKIPRVVSESAHKTALETLDHMTVRKALLYSVIKVL